jgi:predicted DNA-binding transcriptional regulator YafY
MSAARVLALLDLLQSHRQWAGPELARRLEVTDRTLRRDIERLRDLGYRIETTRGTAGGYRLEAGSSVPPLLLTDAEAVTMAIGLRLAAEQGIADAEQVAAGALAKFEQVLPAPVRERVAALSSLSRPATPDAIPVAAELLGQLALVCRDHERVRFRYRSGDVETRRVVEPYALVAVRQRWFLLCWDLERGGWRTFRVDRLSELFATRLNFSPRPLPAPDPAAYVMASVESLSKRYRVEAMLDLPLERMVERFGRWSEGAVAEGPNTTRWPVSAETPELVLGVLAWIPNDIAFELRGDPDLLTILGERADRIAAAAR